MSRTEPAPGTRRMGRRRTAAGRLDPTEAGFTLVELLVVMIIIGVLAAISVPVFLNQRKKAVDAGLKTDLRTVAVSVETYFTDNNAYPVSDITSSGTTFSTATNLNVNLTTGDVIAYKSPATVGRSNVYCLIASRAAGASSASQNWVYISDKGGLQPLGTTVCS
jgi:type IV pilus assembly protein PilA